MTSLTRAAAVVAASAMTYCRRTQHTHTEWRLLHEDANQNVVVIFPRKTFRSTITSHLSSAFNLPGENPSTQRATPESNTFYLSGYSPTTEQAILSASSSVP